MKKNRGSLLIEALLALCIALILFGLGSALLQVYCKVAFDSATLQNSLGIIQLREHLYLAADIEISDDELTYKIENDSYKLALVNRRVIQQPGTLIFLIDVDELEFILEDEAIIMSFKTDKRQWKEGIVYGQ